MATDSIEVAIRVRPLIRRERDALQRKHWKVNENSIFQLVNGKPSPSSCYTFDHVYDEQTTTRDIYEQFAKPKVSAALLGFNATIFAYGQTSSGKTHTMTGDKHNPGIIPHVINHLFDYMNEDYTREYLLVVKFMEIYNENITDLLNPNNKNLKIHENSKKEVFVGDITQEAVSGSNQVFALMAEGEKNRHFGETNMNDRSSRSHTIFCIHIESRERASSGDENAEDIGAVRVSQLNLVDLAGSERVSQTGAEGQRLKEGAHINKSLFTLGSVIAKLSEGESFIPFRDSKLTRILQSSLGGNAKTAILCTVTPVSVEETVSTLKFASRAKTIKNCPLVNEVLDDGAMLKRMKKEIQELKQQLSHMQDNTCLSELQSEKERYQKQLVEQREKYELQIQRLASSFFTPAHLNDAMVNANSGKTKTSKRNTRRETWCPGAILSKNPLASAAEVAQSVFSMDDISMRTISEDCEDTMDSIKSPDIESKLMLEKVQKENEMLKKQLIVANTEKEHLQRDLEEAINDSIAIQKQAFSETQERISKFQDKFVQREQELTEKLKISETKNTELTTERDTLQSQLIQSNDKTEVFNLKIESLNQQINELKIYIDEITEENLQHQDTLHTKGVKISELEARLDEREKDIISGSEGIVMSLKQDIQELQGRLKKKTSSYDNLVLENQESAELAATEIQNLQQQIVVDNQKREKIKEELIAIKVQYEDLSYKYDELRMSSNIQETEMEKMDELKNENKRLKSRLSMGQNLKISEDVSLKSSDLNLSCDSDGALENNEVASLNRTLQTKCQELEHITFLFDERELEIKEARESLEEHQNARKTWEEIVGKKEEEIGELQSEIEFMKLEISEVKNSNQEKENQLDELKGYIKEQEDKIIELEEVQRLTSVPQGEVSEVDTQDMRTMETIKQELDEAKALNIDLTKQKTELENTIITKEEGFIEEKNAFLCSLEDMKTEVNAVKESNIELIQLKSELDNMCKVNEDEFKKEKDTLICSLEQLKTELGEVKATNDELINLKAELENVVCLKEEEFKKEKDTLMCSLEQLKTELGEVKATNDELLDLKAELENAICLKEEEYRKEKDAFLDEKEDYETKLESLNDEILNLIKEKEAQSSKDSETDLEDSSKKGDEYIEELQWEIESLQKDLSEAKSGATESEKQVVMLKEIIKQQEDEMIKIGEKLKTVQQPQNEGTVNDLEVKEMARSLQLLESKVSEVESEKQEMLRQNVELQTIIVEKDEEFRNEMESFQDEKEQYETMVESLNDEVLKLHTEQKNMQQKKDIKKDTIQENAEIEFEIESLQQELHEAKQSEHDKKNQVVELREIIKQQEAEIIKLGEKLDTAAQKNGAHDEEKIKEMESSLQELQGMLETERRATEEYSSRNTELQKLIESKEEEFQKLQEMIPSLQQLENELVKVKRENEDLNGHNSKLQDLVTASEEAFSEEKRQLELKSEMLKEEETKAGELRNIIKEQEAEIIRLGEKLDAEKNKVNSANTEELAVAYQQLSNQLNEVASARDQITQEKAELENLINMKEDEYRQVKNAFLDEKEEYESKVESLNDEILKLHEEMQNLATEKEEAAQKKDGEDASKNNTEEIENLQFEIECLQKELTESKTAENAQESQVVELTKIIKEQENEIIRLSEKLQQSENTAITNNSDEKLEELRSSLEKLTSELKSVENEKEQLLKKYNNLETAVEGKDEEIKTIKENLEGENTEAQTQLESVRQLNEELGTKLQHSEVLIGNLRRVINDQEEEINTSDEERDNLKEQLEKGKSMYEKVLKALENERLITAELQEAMKEAEEEVQSLRDRLEKKEPQQEIQSSENKEQKAQIECLSKELESLKESLEMHEKQSEEHIMAKQAELEDIQDQVVRLEEDNKNQKDLLQKQRKQMKEWHDALTSKQEEISSLQERLNSVENPSQQDADVFQDKINELNKVLAEKNNLNSELQQRLESQEDYHSELKKTLTDSQDENTNLKTTLKDLQEQLIKNQGDLNEHKIKLETAQKQVQAYEKGLSEEKDLQQQVLADEIVRLQRIIDEQQEKLNQTQSKTDENSTVKLKELESTVEESQNVIKNLRESLQDKTSLLDEQSKKADEAEKKQKRLEENMTKQVNRLRKIIDDQQDEIEEALKKNEQLRNQDKINEDPKGSVVKINELEAVVQKSHKTIKDLQEMLQAKTNLLEEQSKKAEEAEKKQKRVEENMSKQVNKLRKIIDDQQDEIDEAVRKNEELKNGSTIKENLNGTVHKNNEVQSDTETQSQIKRLQEALQEKTKKIEEQNGKIDEAEKKIKVKEENMFKQVNRLRKIIDDQQDEIDEAVKKNAELEQQAVDNENKLKEATTEVDRLKAMEHMEQIEALRIELAGKNMKIQELEYKAFKSEEEMDRLRREVQFGYSKMSKLKQGLRKVQDDAVKDDTIPVKRFKSSTAEGDAGVVSSVAVYSLKAKLEQFEKENRQLREDKAQLEKDKVTMSIYKTDASNQASKLSDEVQYLRKQVKDLSKQNRSLKGKEERDTPQNVLAPSNPPSGHNLSSGAQSLEESSLADRRKTLLAQERENRPKYTGWMSPSKTKDMFKDKANQCPHQ